MVTAGKGGSGVGVGGRGGDGVGSGDGRHWSILVNTTIFLLILEGAFVDADNPLFAWYCEAGDCT